MLHSGVNCIVFLDAIFDCAFRWEEKRKENTLSVIAWKMTKKSKWTTISTMNHCYQLWIPLNRRNSTSQDHKVCLKNSSQSHFQMNFRKQTWRHVRRLFAQLVARPLHSKWYRARSRSDREASLAHKMPKFLKYSVNGFTLVSSSYNVNGSQWSSGLEEIIQW